MKQRIISGGVMAGIVILVLILGLNFNSAIITLFLAVIAAIGTWEFVCNAIGLKDKVFQIMPMVYTAVIVPIISEWLENTLRMSLFFNGNGTTMEVYPEQIYVPFIAAMVTVIYFLACAVLILIKQEELNVEKIVSLCAMPLFLAFAFSAISSIITATSGIYYLLLVLNFSCVCDIGAYFVGVNFGKTKLCPQISPNKTVEGALGGMASSLVFTLILTLCFGKFSLIIPTFLVTIPLCAVGIIGDLFASIIKRKTGIKDYGYLIPGHGGVLDRVDSIMFVATAVYCLVFAGVI